MGNYEGTSAKKLECVFYTVLIYLKVSHIFSQFLYKISGKTLFSAWWDLQNYLSSLKEPRNLGYAFNNTQNTEYLKLFQLVKMCFAFSQVFAVTNAEATDLERIFLHYSDCLEQNL